MQTVGVVRVVSLTSVRQETDCVGREGIIFFLKYYTFLLLLVKANN